MKSHRLFGIVNKILVEDYNLRIYHVSQQDRYMLMTLDVWKQLYRCSIRRLIAFVMPDLLKRRRTMKRKRIGGVNFGMPIRWLVNKSAEELICRHLPRAYPDREHLTTWRQYVQQKLLMKRQGVDEYPPRIKKLWEYQTVAEYLRSYDKHIKTNRKEYQKALNQETRRAYRNSPW